MVCSFSKIQFPLLLSSLALHAVAVTPAIVMRQSGPHTNRIDIVYAAEAFTAPEMATFVTSVNRAMMYRDTGNFAAPFKRYRNFFNFYRLELISQVSGITASVQNTPLQGRHDNDRLGTVNSTRLRDSVAAGLAAIGVVNDGWNHAVLNAAGYYNSGGSNTCVFSYNYWGEIALHEGGHAFHALADEYGGPGTYSGGEPRELNVTANSNTSTIKWSHWVGYNQPGNGVMGAYEGGRYFDQGIWRPDNNSKMNITSQQRPTRFNIVSIEKILQDIYAKVRPVDSNTPTAATLTDPDSLFARVIDPAVIWVDWYLDGNLVRTNGGQVLRLGSLANLPLGSHQIRAHVYDEVVIRANSPNAAPHVLDLARLPAALTAMQQDLTWNVNITQPPTPVLGLSTAYRGPISATLERGGFSFKLPEEGGYALRVYSMRGKLLREFTGQGVGGRNFVPLRAEEKFSPGAIVTKLTLGGIR